MRYRNKYTILGTRFPLFILLSPAHIPFPISILSKQSVLLAHHASPVARSMVPHRHRNDREA